MLNELLEMLGGDDEGERGCCQQRQPRANGVRGFIARLLSGDDDDAGNQRASHDGCCSRETRDGDTPDAGRPNRRRDRDERNNDFDFGD